MKWLFTSLALLLLTVASTWSQTRLCFDSTAVQIDSIPTQVAMASGANGTCTAILELTVWRSTSGRIYFSIAPESVQFSGNGDVVDAMTTPKIFDLLSVNAVSVGIARGYLGCPGSCVPPANTRVGVAECVQRNGTGIATRFVTCSPAECCYREYTACCAAGPGSPTITLVGRFGSGCPQGTLPPCQSTCQ